MQKQKRITPLIQISNLITVIATQNISMIDTYGYQVFIKKGAILLLDEKEMIANYSSYHFDVSSDEVMYQQVTA